MNNENMKIKIILDKITKPQLLALYQFFKNWEPLCKRGSSKIMSYMVDGDGNLHPDITLEIPSTITSDEIKLAEECYSNELNIDFDRIAWKLREIEEE